ncbi:hypothetical protein [Streptococcus equinus]|uniref:hypothetical protein n=1 Tax=Streptococcus equinus TaxID=1335 RepID=UPI00215A25A8|nr:hypothetical protein [Streptococcus equinus]
MGKKYYKTAKKWATPFYAEHRFSKDCFGNTIIKKAEKTADCILDFIFGTSDNLKKNKSHNIVKMKGGRITKNYEGLMKIMGETNYSTLWGSLISEAKESFNIKTIENVFEETKKTGQITKSVKTAFKESNIGTALKTGSKFAKGVAVLNVIDGAIETFDNVGKNKTQAKKQGLHGAEVSASVATGFVIDAAKATVNSFVTVAAAKAGASAAYLLDYLDKKYKITDSTKVGVNNIIKNGFNSLNSEKKE